MQIKDLGNGDYIECPGCTTALYTGELEEELVEAAVANPSLHQSLLRQLISGLKRNREIEKGKTEVIAGEDTRHRPDAIFYYRDDHNQNKPIIFEVETCESISNINTLSQLVVFSLTSKYTKGDFYLVIPRNCNGMSAEELAQKIIDDNGIDSEYVEIITF